MTELKPSSLEERGVSRCACGIQFNGMPAEHRAHLAEVIYAHMSKDNGDEGG